MTALPRADRPLHVRALAALLAATLALPPAHAATALADQPLFASAGVPGNLALPLSVEFPTAVSVAHQPNIYVSGDEYLGYFDPDKCYGYQAVDVESASLRSHFYPAGAATGHTCVGAANDWKWSGNFLNWATMQTIDPFRWALTGGYRVVDIPGLTILEKAWHTGQGGLGNFPLRVVADATALAAATPFRGSVAWSSQIAGQGQMMAVSVDGALNTVGGLLGTYYNSVDLSGDPVLTRFEMVDYDFLLLSPAVGVVNNDNFSARWTSSQTAPSTGTYSFQTTSDDGVRLYVNGVAVINNWTDHAPVDNTSTNVTLNAGDPLNIRLEYYERGGGAVIRLRWKPPGAPAYITYNPGSNRLPVRVKVCDPSLAAGGIESNCTAYSGGNYKPEGLMQQYANRIRYSVFGYLNDGNIRRDGGVLRARQKFVGPTYPRPGLADATNGEREWDASTGVYAVNPDAVDAEDTATVFGTPISNSGVLNYLNKFGEITKGSYKTYDPVGELYYAALRYYRNLGNVPAWSDMAGADPATKATWADGFPVITDWKLKRNVSADPIQYECQKNFVLGIGDVNTHADKNVPGSGMSGNNEPTRPSLVVADGSSDAVAKTNQVGVMQGIGGSLGTAENVGGCCNNNGALMAGLAFDANTRDIRPDLANPAGTIGQTVQTFWVDVLEAQQYKSNNQFYLAAKYGGFTVPTSFDAASTAPLPTALWSTSGDTVGGQPRPDNYFTAGRPDQMVDGLTKAFASIASQLKAFTTSFSTALPQVETSGNASFSASYDAQTWTGDVIASELSFDGASGTPTIGERWKFSDKLLAQAAGAGWNTGRVIATWNAATAAGVAFRHASISPAQRSALDTTYRSAADSSDYLNYLRGDRSLEKGTTTGTSGNPYRLRTKLVGDIVGSKTLVVAAPPYPYSNAANPGYGTFKTANVNRRKVVYVGANDGMLHAIDASLTDTSGGTELFAYVPGALFNGPTTPATAANASVDGLAALGNPTFTHKNFVNATHNVYDIDFARTPGGSGSPNWRSVLIGALGKGGKSYYALDVTDPAAMTSETAVASKVLWEFSDPELGFTYGEPVVVKTKKYGWVVIFGSGYNSGAAGTFFIVNPRTGALLEKRSTGAGTATNDAGLAQLSAHVWDSSDNTANAVYAGDLLGNLWRLDLTAASGAYPAPLKIAQLTDAAGTPQPVTSSPVIKSEPKTMRRFVMVGTGRLLDSSDVGSTQGQTFYAILDGDSARFNSPAPANHLPSGVNFPLVRANLVANTDPVAGVTLAAASMGWYVDLGSGTGGIGWRVLIDPKPLAGNIAFVSTLPNGSACSPSGRSRPYELEIGNGKSRLTATMVVAGVSTTSAIPYNDTISGLITDLKYLNVGGTIRLVAGSDTGGLTNIDRRATVPPGLRRLNWRELPLVN